MNGKITAQNHSALLTYIYTHTHARSYLLVSGMKMTDTHMHTLIPTLNRVHKHTYISERVSLTHFQECLPYIHTHVAVY